MSSKGTIQERTVSFVEDNGLLLGVSRLGLAVSGGSDSMALMYLLADYCKGRGIGVVVLCFDHAIEGENSIEESRFVKSSAEALGLEVCVERSVPPVSQSPGVSIEMAARHARRAFYARAAAKYRLDAIATGHQRDDVAETMLLRLMRGSGATGLSGLRPYSPKADGIPAVIRPLLVFGRGELRSWLVENDLKWMEDVANSNTAIPRCRVRLKAIPSLAGAVLLPEGELTASLAQSADILAEEDSFLDAIARKWLRGQGGVEGPLDVASLLSEPLAIARRVVRIWLMANAGADAAGFGYVGEVLSCTGSVNLPCGKVLDIENGRATIRRDFEVETSVATIGVGETVQWGRFAVRAEIGNGIDRLRYQVGVWPAGCTLSLRSLNGGRLTIRSRRDGDRIAPYGIDGWQKVQDVFVNCKLPSEQRDSYPLLFLGDELVWIPGYRIARRCLAADCEPVLRLTVEQNE